MACDVTSPEGEYRCATDCQRKCAPASTDFQKHVHVLRDPLSETADHLRITAVWTKQLETLIATTSDSLVHRSLTTLIQRIEHLQHLCYNFTDLLCLREKLDAGQSYAPIPKRLQAKPSVQAQLSQHKELQITSADRNYYQILSCPSDARRDTSPSENHESNKRSLSRMNVTPTTFNKNNLDALIKEFTDKDPPVDTPRPEAPADGKSFRIRFSLRMGNFTTTATLRDKLEAALSAFRAHDSSLCIMPFRKDDAATLPQLFNSSDIPTELAQIQRYFRFRINPKTPSTQLVGHIHVASSLPADELLASMQSKQYKGRFELTLHQCQAEETAMIGFLVKSSDLINRKDLTAGILKHPLWDPSAGFEFVLSRQNFRAGSESVMCLGVEATATKAKEANAFFERLYDGENKELPHGLELYYVPVLQGCMSEDDRATFVQIQKAFATDEKAISIAGFTDLEDLVKLADDSTIVTLRNLLLSLPVLSNGNAKFFQGIDRQPAARTNFLIARISGTLTEKEISITMDQLEQTIRNLVHASNYSAVFKDPDEGLRYGGIFAQHGRRRPPPGIPSPERKDHIHRIRTKLAPQQHKPSPATPSAWNRSSIVPASPRSPFTSPVTTRPSPEPGNSMRAELSSLKTEMENFKIDVDQKIAGVHGAMSQGFAEVKALMDDIIGIRSTVRNVRARMDVDEES